MLDITVWCGLPIECHSHTVTERGQLQGLPPCTSCYLLPSDWLASKIEKKEENLPMAKSNTFSQTFHRYEATQIMQLCLV